MKIESGTGNGFMAAISSENKLQVASVNLSRQHFISKVKQKAFQVVGEATATNGTTTVLHMKNTTSDQLYVINYIRLNQIDLAGGTAIPNAANFFRLGSGLEYASGGSTTNAVNTYLGSVTSSGGVFYEANPTMTGSLSTLDKNYPKDDGGEQGYRKEGSLIIPPGVSFTVQFDGDNTSGNLYARVSFYAAPADSLDT